MLPSRWQAFSSSIFSKMSQMAAAHQAVNLAQGFPDFDGPDVIKEAAIAAIRGAFNQYAPSTGLGELRRQLAQRQAAQYGLQYDFATEVTVFSGATEAIFCCMMGLCGPGDEVLTFEPFFDCYPAACAMAGAVLKTVPLKAPDWSFAIEDLRNAITERTRVLILNSPHNPSGKVFTRHELLSLAQLVQEKNLIVVTDEVYEELIFTPARHLPMARLDGMRDRTITISSTAKTFSLTGWKVGFAFAEKKLTELIRIPHQYTVFCSATPLQAGMIAAFQLGQEYFLDFRELYTRRRDTLLAILRRHGFVCKAPEGTYFITADYRSIRDVPDMEFATWLTEKVGVACLPISNFYLDAAAASANLRLVRFAFCKQIETLEAAGRLLQERLPEALAALKN
ncbi:MAG TPA: aminotransferase class I/II-fold pyridoxal phosphate-dependent enzyme [Oligoflexus sp.]|uniref:aminotransferase class I/II-fold pyridoxal phosphate-dependent enzyme n=1 Tax=Oligoflexus sp. TaxID=1971216 RepID=UPI002D74264C|nr:aminotransferase class I/II-fold pyridoxal phosphate-dependent enzyme [Oligoflexus sp.]HYX37443.1 aminotransferase class I/II-fold pyridoxal phosphate-dependent enzyme [Oligoflexus sp.]